MAEEDELRELLDELGKDEPIDLTKISSKAKKSKPKSKSDGTVTIQPFKRKGLPSKKPTDEKDFSALEVEKSDPSAKFQEQFYGLLAKYGPITDDIINTYESDRQQAQEVLDHFLNTISTGGKIPRIYIEKIADVLKAKNDIAQTPIRMLDSITKLMSASKGSEVLNQINMSFDHSGLADLLDTATYEDEQDS